MSTSTGIGYIKLSDGTILKLKILIIDVKEIGFSPFGGINFDVKVIGGIATESIPDDVKKLVVDKPLAPSELPKEGWEILDIIEQKTAEATDMVTTSIGTFLIKVIAETVMVSRNVMYKVPTNEPIYWASWVYKISWKPIKT